MGRGQIDECPVLHPSEEEFKDPLGYIARIRETCEPFGMCRIVPPKSWDPPFALDTESFRFSTKVQALHRLQARPAAWDPETFKLEYGRFLSSQYSRAGDAAALFAKSRVYQDVELDPCSLYNAVRRHGGLERVSRMCLWQDVLAALPRASHPPSGHRHSGSGSVASTLSQLYREWKLSEYESWRAAGGGETPYEPPPQVKGYKSRGSNRNGNPKSSSQEKPQAASAQAPTDDGTPDAASEEGRSSRGRDRRSYGASRDTRQGGNVAKVGKQQVGSRTMDSGESSSSEEEDSGQVCERCNAGGHEDQMLLCDRCNKGWHMYCLSPPLTEVPAGNWYCQTCLTGSDNAFGFGTGAEISLASLQRMDDRVRRKVFGTATNPDGSTSSPPVSSAKLEEAFWGFVEGKKGELEVLYGSDQDTSICGSGFPKRGSPCPPNMNPERWQKYANSPWNLNNLPTGDGSVLRFVKDNVPGVIVPWLYMGMTLSAFCWHFEDHCFYSINYVHWWVQTSRPTRIGQI